MSRYADQQQVVNAKTGRVERIFVDLQAIYPNADDPCEEMSFEELRAQSRGWLSMDWTAEKKESYVHELKVDDDLPQIPAAASDNLIDNVLDLPIQHSQPESQKIDSRDESGNGAKAPETKAGRPKKMKVMEIKGETQTGIDL